MSCIYVGIVFPQGYQGYRPSWYAVRKSQQVSQPMQVHTGYSEKMIRFYCAKRSLRPSGGQNQMCRPNVRIIIDFT